MSEHDVVKITKISKFTNDTHVKSYIKTYKMINL